MSDTEEFTVPVGPGGGLAAVATALARRLEAESSGTDTVAVFVSVVGVPKRFTQCLVHAERGVWAECVSNAYLTGDLRLSQVDEDLLVAAGFNRPNDFSPNFHEVVEPPVDFSAVANLLVAPFATVFLCSEIDVVKVRVQRPFQPDADEDEECDWDEEDDDWFDGAVG